MPEQLMPGRGSYRGGGDLDIPLLPPPPQKLSPPPPPPRIFTTKFQHYSRMVYARANYFRMAISTSRMPQKQCQSIYFSKIFWGGMPPDLPSGGVLYALRIDANFGIPPQLKILVSSALWPPLISVTLVYTWLANSLFLLFAIHTPSSACVAI